MSSFNTAIFYKNENKQIIYNHYVYWIYKYLNNIKVYTAYIDRLIFIYGFKD